MTGKEKIWLEEMLQKGFDAVVLANGTFPEHSIPLGILKNAEFLVCCDAAAQTLLERTAMMPHAIVGDGDSLPQQYKERLAEIFHQYDEQDFNDMTKATRFLIECGKVSPKKRSIAYLGATGKREDHTLGNISLMGYYKKEYAIDPVMFTDHGVFSSHYGNAVLPTFKGQQVSIFNLSSTEMNSKGLKWQIAPFSELWMGTLNEALEDTVEIRANGRYIVFQTYP